MQTETSLPLVVGVTGHRCLIAEHIPRIKDQVKAVFTQIRVAFPIDEILLISPLAEGADQLVADVALEFAPVTIVVPLAFSDYVSKVLVVDACTPAEELLKKYSELRALANEELSFNFGVDPITPKERDSLYKRVTAFIVRHSHVLIAITDDDNPDAVLAPGEIKLTSIASEALRYLKHGVPQPLDGDLLPPHPVHVSEDGILYHIYGPRVGITEEVKPNEACQITRVAYGMLGSESYQNKSTNSWEDFTDVETKIFESLTSYNSIARRIGRRKLPYPPLKELAEKLNVPPAFQELAHAFDVADMLAVKFRRRAHLAYGVLLWIVIAATVSFGLYAHWPFGELPTGHSYLLIVYAVLVLGAWFLRWWTQKCLRLQDHYQDYRALAEGLRVQFFWHLIGLEHSVAQRYLMQQRSALDWIRNGLFAWDVRTYAARKVWEPVPTTLSVVKKEWLENQKDYFNRSLCHSEKAHHRAEQQVGVLILLSIVGSCLTYSLMIHDEPLTISRWTVSHDSFHLGAILFLHLLLVAAAVIHLHDDKNGHEAHIRRYRQMYTLYSRSIERLDNPSLSKEQIETILIAVGDDALRENGDWIMTHRERPLAVVAV